MKTTAFRRSLLGVSLVLFNGLVSVSFAEDEPHIAITDLSQVDADYHDQGEYVGPVTMNGYTSTIGVQVVALGAGNFDALVYRGGLPGNGYDGSPRIALAGSRSGDQVILKGDNLVLFLQTGFAAVLKSPSGDRLGFLQPVKRISPTQGAVAPPNAMILFDGHGTDQLKDAKVTPEGLLQVGTETKAVFQNFTLHGEFQIPYMPTARGQGRGNSGFYLQKRYEVQVLDSFGLELKFNDCASLYRFKAPDLNMSFPPLRWQTYDIQFTAPRFSADGQKCCKGVITVRHNGVVVHNQLVLENKTGGGSIEGPNPLPILLQNHKNPVRYRNLWIIDHDQAGCPSPSYVMTSVPVCREQGCRIPFRFRHAR